MVVQYSKYKSYLFKGCGKGLYYLDISNLETIPLTADSGDIGCYLLSTMNANMD